MTTITPYRRAFVTPLRRLVTVGIAVAVALGVNLALYGIGRAAGGHFAYTQSGRPNTVDAASVAIMSIGPLAVGLAAVAGLAPRWPALITAARIVAPILALGTIALMTLPAHFDPTSTVILSCMHSALVPIALLAIAAFERDASPSLALRRRSAASR